MCEEKLNHYRHIRSMLFDEYSFQLIALSYSLIQALDIYDHNAKYLYLHWLLLSLSMSLSLSIALRKVPWIKQGVINKR